MKKIPAMTSELSSPPPPNAFSNSGANASSTSMMPPMTRPCIVLSLVETQALVVGDLAHVFAAPDAARDDAGRPQDQHDQQQAASAIVVENSEEM